MKKILIISLVALVVLGGLFALYYFCWTADNLASLGADAMAAGKYSRAAWFYERAVALDPQNPNYCISLVDVYVAEGSYPQAERCLNKAIHDAPSAILIAKLSSIYVAQDKLYGAISLLDGITDDALKAEVDAMRPVAPELTPAGGEYSEYIDVMFTEQPETIYYSSNGHYPSIEGDVYSGPFALNAGDTFIQAVAVNESGLVSPLSKASYTIVGVVEPVQFSNSTFEEYVRAMLYIPDSVPVMTSDLWSVDTLTISTIQDDQAFVDIPYALEIPTDMTDFSDLRHFSCLTELHILNQPLTGVADPDATNTDKYRMEDYSFLTSMPNLEKLDLSGCSVSDDVIDYIGTLDRLTYLNLSSQNISDIAGLQNLTALTFLDLSNNAVSDLSALSQMTNLSELNLASNAVFSLESLAELQNITLLDISGNGISSLSDLAQCSGLKELKASDNTITNVDVLGSMSQLERLELAKNEISEIDALSGCTALKYLDLSDNDLTSVNAIAGMVDLTYLNINRNQVAAIPTLSPDAHLQQFLAENNQLTDLSPLSGLPELAVVNVDYNAELSNIVVLAACPMIARIDAFGTKVADSDELNRMITEMMVSITYTPTIGNYG